jgi:hypothetical protein
MLGKKFIASWYGFALIWFTVGKASDLDIAQIPLSSCLSDSQYHSSSALATDPIGGLIYQAKYRASDWSGKLLAFQANSTGSLDRNNDGVVNDSDALWEAGNALETNNSRKAYSFFYPDFNCIFAPFLYLYCTDPLFTGIVFNPDHFNGSQADL